MTTKHRTGHRFVWPVALTVTILAAQAPAPVPPTAQKDIVLHATTRLVQVSIIAQSHGEPVADLKKEDFQIRDNGKVQTVSMFSMDASSSGQLLPHPTEKLPPNIFTNELEQRPGMPTSVSIILLDGLNTNTQDQIYSRNQVVKFLKTIQPGDRVGLYVLGNGLKVLHDFTSDATDLIAQLDSYKGQNLPDVAASEGAVMDTDALGLNNWRAAGGSSGAERDFYTVDRVLGTLRALEFIANHLARLPGRKNLIWVSGGFPLEIGFDSLDAFKDPSRDQRTFTDEVDRTIRAMNNANLAIYPVDARGLVPDRRFDAANQKIDLAPKLSMGPIVKNQQTMSELASRTGGRAYYNTNDLNHAIRDAVADSRVTYTLGFYPSGDEGKGKFHKLDVKVVERSGVSLRYRKGYFDDAEKPLDPKARMIELKDAVIDPLEATSLGLIVGIKPDPTNKAAVTVVVKVDQKGISLEPNADRWSGKIDVVLVQKNARGQQFNGIEETIDLNLTRPTYDKLVKEQGLLFSKALTLVPQAKELRVVVRDVPSGTLGSVTVAFNQIVRK
jgi:VWFA-related protein